MYKPSLISMSVLMGIFLVFLNLVLSAQVTETKNGPIDMKKTRAIFTTTTLTADAELVIEVGGYKIKDDDGDVKSEGKYLVGLETGKSRLENIP